MESLPHLRPPYHIVLFPFMSKGHTIPQIDLAQLLLRRGLSLTIFTAPENSSFLHRALSCSNVRLIDLSIPNSRVETTHQSSVDQFVSFAQSTKLLQPAFEQTIQALPHVDCMITDGFLGWTQKSAAKFGIPRLVYYGMSAFAMTISTALTRDRPHKDLASDHDSFSFSYFPWITFTKNDFDPPFRDPEPRGPAYDFIIEQGTATMESRGILVNSFYELEPAFVDYWNREFGPRAWCVGPFCLAQPTVEVEPLPNEKPIWVQWLDARAGESRPVLYVAFGSQAEVSDEQLVEISIGLERSEVDFLWVLRSNVSFDDGYEERVDDRGLVVREWVEQREILGHESVKGFLSHCGWNSVIESVYAGVPILTWPLMAEQGLNAKMVVEELGIGLRLATRDSGLVNWERVEKMVRELMGGEKGKAVAEKAREEGKMARRAMEEGSGSSWCTLDKLINDVCCSSPRI